MRPLVTAALDTIYECDDDAFASGPLHMAAGCLTAVIAWLHCSVATAAAFVLGTLALNYMCQLTVCDISFIFLAYHVPS